MKKSFLSLITIGLIFLLNGMVVADVSANEIRETAFMGEPDDAKINLYSGGEEGYWTYINGEKEFVQGNGEVFGFGTATKVIDLSQWNGYVYDWQAVENSGVDGAILRPMGNNSNGYYTDEQFNNNVEGAQSVGIEIGAYVYSYANTPQEAIAEANYCLSVFDKYGLTPSDFNYPIYFDMEDEVQAGLSVKQLEDIYKAFKSTMNAAGYEVYIYCSYNWAENILTSPYLQSQIGWVARYSSDDVLGYTNEVYYSGLFGWQYTDNATVPGISGTIDMNVFSDSTNQVNDKDDDGLTDAAETFYGTNPKTWDTDNDGCGDYAEIKTYFTNPKTWDTDNDGCGDRAEIVSYGTNPNSWDTDKDGSGDRGEIASYKTDPKNSDTDNDGLSDCDEIAVHESNPIIRDTDDDNLDDGQEIYYGTNLNTWDTDKDGSGDYSEITLYFTTPTDADTDSDGLNDCDEIIAYKTNPNSVDTDGDSISDYTEIITHRTNPKNPLNTSGTRDTDGDKLSDEEEKFYGTNPKTWDTDNDGCGDYAEIKTYFTNPKTWDTDADGSGDCTEISSYETNPNSWDTDEDGSGDRTEISSFKTNPINSDTDNDGLNDCTEIADFQGNPLSKDTDGDKVMDSVEQLRNTKLNSWDSDGDGSGDYSEMKTYFTNPKTWDTDTDGSSDCSEIASYETNPSFWDTDRDGSSDKSEIASFETDPKTWDTDYDEVSDCDEIAIYGTDPLDPDSDNDGISDSDE